MLRNLKVALVLFLFHFHQFHSVDFFYRRNQRQKWRRAIIFIFSNVEQKEIKRKVLTFNSGKRAQKDMFE